MIAGSTRFTEIWKSFQRAVQTPRDIHVWLWPGVIATSCLLAGIVILAEAATPIRPIVALWFIFFCPGIAFTRLLGLNEPLSEASLAVVTSLSICAVVAGVLLYAGAWSLAGAMVVLMIISLLGSVLQLFIPLRPKE